MDFGFFSEKLTQVSAGLSRSEFIACIKQIEQDLYAWLKMMNNSSWYRGKGLEISSILSQWKDEVIRKSVESVGNLPGNLVLVAVGGYGRKELSPYSDVDLLILRGKRLTGEENEFIRQFLYLLWDFGYKLGNSVRTIPNIAEDAFTDPSFMTSLLEKRLILGNPELYMKIDRSLEKVLKSIRKQFLKDKISELDGIAGNYEDEVLLKEMDLKNSPGGLRSVHRIIWLNAVFYNQPGLQGLGKLLDPLQTRKIVNAYDFILYIRNMLHFNLGRHEDMLLIEYQKFIAESLGIRGSQRKIMIKLMRFYYGRAMDIFLSELYSLELFSFRFLKMKKTKIPQGDYFSVRGKFYVGETISESPSKAFETLKIFIGGNYSYSWNLIHYLKKCSRRLGKAGIDSRENFVLFREVLNMDHSYSALKVMMLSGFLYEYMTPVKNIRYMIVHNPFHRYTVDQHSIESIRALEQLFDREHPEEILKTEVLRSLAGKYKQNIWIVKMALLLHDCGKAFEGDHAKNGEDLAYNYLLRVPTESLFKEMVCFLIENHLLLSNISRRSNIDDEVVLSNLSRAFINTSFPVESLELLYMVTYADISATNRRNYNGFTAGLLKNLFIREKSLVDRKASGNERKTMEDDFKDPELKSFVADLGKSYMMMNQMSEMIEDYGFFKNMEGKSYKMRISLYNDYLKVKIIAPDRSGLFSLLCGNLLLNGADIVRADIHTYRQTAIDEFIITSIFGNEVLEEKMNVELNYWKKDVEKSLERYMLDPAKLNENIKYLQKKTGKPSAVFYRVPVIHVITKDVPNIEISCTDRPGLLYDISYFLSEMGLEIKNALIDTNGWYVRDIFELEKRGNEPDWEQLIHSLRQIVDQV